MYLSQAEAGRQTEQLLRAWILRVQPPVEVSAAFASQMLDVSGLQDRCQAQQLLLLSELAAGTLHLLQVGVELDARVQELAQISHLLARWHMPDHLKTRRSGGDWLQWLATVVPACWLVLLWASQLRSGCRRQVRARRGVRFLHPLVQRALSGSRTGGAQMWAAVEAFLLRQFTLVVSPPPEEACLYVLGSRGDVYVGITASARKGRQASMSGAAWRYWEHLVEIFRPSRDPSQKPSQKVSCFRQCRMGHVGMLVVALGTRPDISGMEAAAIASGGCRGNTAGTRGTGLMPRRHGQRHGHCRGRLPPQSRPGPADAVRATVHWLAGAKARQRKAETRRPRREAAASMARVRRLPYAEQYRAWQRARWQLGLGAGPVDILGTQADALLAAWLAGKSGPCPDSLRERAGGDDLVALRACDAAQMLAPADGKRRALERVGRLLRLWGLPTRGMKTIPWPGATTKIGATGPLRSVKESLTARGRRLWDWVKARTRVVLPKRASYADRWNHIRTARTSRMCELLDSQVAVERPPAPAQAATRRVKRYWKLPGQVRRSDALREGVRQARYWARRNFGSEYRPARGDLCGLGRAACRDRPEDHAGGQELALYAEALSQPRAGEVLVQEDKDKVAAWCMPAETYLHWIAHLLLADPGHWERVDCTLQGVRDVYHDLHRTFLPARFKHMCSRDKWSRFRLNYMYMNLKTKCFREGQGRTCAKAGHSCLRKVVSWCSHPAVGYYRLIARGVQTLAGAWGRSFEVRSLKTAAADLRKRAAELEAPDRPFCLRCGCYLPGPAVVVADAAQMYEEVPPSRVRAGLEDLIAWAELAGYTGVVVSRISKGQCHLAKQCWKHPPATEVFSWSELRVGASLALAQNAVSVGDFVWRQKEGLPIGGPHSPACCSVTLGADEASWMADAARRVQHGFGPAGVPLASQVALARYVDDLIMVSRVWCRDCLEAMLEVMYRKPVQFDRQGTSPHGQPWLDMWVAFSAGDLVIHMDGQEQDWVAGMACCPPSKLRLKPYLGDEECSKDALRLHVSARSARLRQAALGRPELRKAVERELLVLALHGYPRAMLHAAWSRCPQYPAASVHARAVLNTWRVALPDLVRLRPDWTWERPAEAVLSPTGRG